MGKHDPQLKYSKKNQEIEKNNVLNAENVQRNSITPQCEKVEEQTRNTRTKSKEKRGRLVGISSTN